MRLSRRDIPLFVYPAGFPATYVLLSFGNLPTPTTDLIRPLAMVIVASVLLAVVLGLLLRNVAKGSLLTTLLAVLVTAPFVVVAIIGVVVLVVVIQLMRHRWTVAKIREATAAQLARSASVFSAALLFVSVVLTGPDIVAGVFLPEAADASGDGPDVYVVVLDGYPRTDTLSSVYSYDNSWFEAELETLGFEVVDDARSNYAHSWMSLTTLFHGEYAHRLPGLAPVPPTAEEQYRSLMRALNNGELLGAFADAGYRVESIPPPFKSMALLTAEIGRDGGQMTAFEYSLVTNSSIAEPIVGLFADALLDQQRDRFEAALATLASEMPGNQPRFVLAHLFSPPHAPLVYDADGGEVDLPSCVPTSCSFWEFPDDAAWDRLAGQVHYANTRLLDAMRAIVARDPEAVVIVMSDHGSRRTTENLDEFFRIFFAARTPGRDLFADVHTVNVLRTLADSYLGADLGPLPYEAWYSAVENKPLNVELQDARP